MRSNQFLGWRQASWLVLLMLLAPGWRAAAAPPGSKRPLDIRGRSQDVFVYPAAGRQSRGPILFMPGDGGWRGFAVTVAEQLSSSGFDVYGFDTKRYLESFTSAKSALRETEVVADMRFLAESIRKRPEDRVILIGWSEGAGLGVLAGAAAENKQVFRGIVTIGLPDYVVLGWRLLDNVTYVTKRKPDEPTVSTWVYLPKIAPLPLLMIHSSGDEYADVSLARKLFGAAREPKRFSLVEAQNHKFDGNRDEFFRNLREGLGWMIGTAR